MTHVTNTGNHRKSSAKSAYTEFHWAINLTSKKLAARWRSCNSVHKTARDIYLWRPILEPCFNRLSDDIFRRAAETSWLDRHVSFGLSRGRGPFRGSFHYSNLPDPFILGFSVESRGDFAGEIERMTQNLLACSFYRVDIRGHAPPRRSNRRKSSAPSNRPHDLRPPTEPGPRHEKRSGELDEHYTPRWSDKCEPYPSSAVRVARSPSMSFWVSSWGSPICGVASRLTSCNLAKRSPEGGGSGALPWLNGIDFEVQQEKARTAVERVAGIVPYYRSPSDSEANDGRGAQWFWLCPTPI